MTEKVKINITASDNASATIGKITGSLGSMDKIIQSQVLRDVGQKMTQAFNFAKREVIGLTSELDNYGQEVQKISRLTGMSLTESSRMIQVADDNRVSVEELTMALKLAAQRGITPNVTGLAKLADQYNALPSAAEKAKFAQDNFGRGWVNMAKLLEKGGTAIKANADAIDASLIFDEKKKKLTDDLFKAQDDLSDAFMGVRLELATALMPAMEQFAEIMTKYVVPTVQEIAKWFTALPEPMRNTVLGIGGLGLIAGAFVLGPGLQLIGTLAQIGMVLGPAGLGSSLPAITTKLWAMAPAVWASVGPFILLAGAIALLAKVIYDNWATIQKLQMLLSAQYLLTGKLPEAAWSIKEPEKPGMLNAGKLSNWMYQDYPGMNAAPGTVPGPGILPPTPGYSGNIGNAQFVYNQNGISLGTQEEAERILLPMMRRLMKEAGQ